MLLLSNAHVVASIVVLANGLFFHGQSLHVALNKTLPATFQHLEIDKGEWDWGQSIHIIEFLFKKHRLYVLHISLQDEVVQLFSSQARYHDSL